MASNLHPVTGNAKSCAPCTLSTITGKPSETWPDRGMLPQEMQEALASCEKVISVFIAPSPIPLLEFGILAPPKNTLWVPTLNWPLFCPGLWALSLVNDPDAYTTVDLSSYVGHCVAVSISRDVDNRGVLIRHACDNIIRKPATFSSFAKQWREHEINEWYVTSGIHLASSIFP